jgi:hypothetical protein
LIFVIIKGGASLHGPKAPNHRSGPGGASPEEEETNQGIVL